MAHTLGNKFGCVSGSDELTDFEHFYNEFELDGQTYVGIGPRIVDQEPYMNALINMCQPTNPSNTNIHTNTAFLNILIQIFESCKTPAILMTGAPHLIETYSTTAYVEWSNCYHLVRLIFISVFFLFAALANQYQADGYSGAYEDDDPSAEAVDGVICLNIP